MLRLFEGNAYFVTFIKIETLPSMASIVRMTSVFSTDGRQSYFWYLSPLD